MSETNAPKQNLTPAQQLILDKAAAGGSLSPEDFKTFKLLKAAEAGASTAPFSPDDLAEAIKFMQSNEPK